MKIEIEKSVIQKVITGIKCDVCGKTTSDIDDPTFYNFSSHHSSWGNDSIDSYENHDVCSVTCYITKLEVLVKEAEYDTFEADGKKLPFLEQLITQYKLPSS